MAAAKSGTAKSSAESSSSTEPLRQEAPEDFAGGERIQRVLERELGEQVAGAFARTRRMEEHRTRERYPHEGLRERKKRLTRQQISDVATTLFVARGFEHVKVSEVAEIVGVSEKTVYNYFPTKESLVFDRADEQVERLAEALRKREPGESPTRAMLRALSEDMEDFEDLPDEVHGFMPRFAEMVTTTPSLRAAWLDVHGRLLAVATEELAARADMDPRDPEPVTVARAIVGLLELAYESRIRHIESGLRRGELREAVQTDIERAARLLDTGLWSFNLLAQGMRTRQQLQDAAKVAEEARAQVVKALRQARSAWRSLHKQDPPVS